eukprot:scaffold8046_cov121-Skeletonema_marinoi.AAC.2
MQEDEAGTYHYQGDGDVVMEREGAAHGGSPCVSSCLLLDWCEGSPKDSAVESGVGEVGMSEFEREREIVRG